MSNKKIFIDTNIFISCAAEEASGIDYKVLEKILNKLNSNKFNLLLPQVIRQEILSTHPVRFDALRYLIKEGVPAYLKNDKDNKIINDNLKKSKDDIINEINKKQKNTLIIIKKILKHKSVINIRLTEEDMISGLKRACLQKAPATKIKFKGKTQYEKDVDCVAYESILNYFNNNDSKKSELIICTNDGDYIIKNQKKISLHPEIKKELKTKCKSVTTYNNPLKLLNNEFKVGYKKEQVKKYEEKIVTQATVPDWTSINTQNQGTFYDGNVANSLNSAPFYPSGQLETAALSTETASFDQIPHIHTTGDFIRINTKNCPNCDADIKHEVESFFANEMSFAYKIFKCPSCSKQFYTSNF